jgi:Rho-type GTPase-activating protein 1/2
MTGDDAYHAHCFKCKVCKNRIDELIFAKTSTGIYCMNCHNDRMAKMRERARRKKEKEKELERRQGTGSGSVKSREGLVNQTMVRFLLAVVYDSNSSTCLS